MPNELPAQLSSLKDELSSASERASTLFEQHPAGRLMMKPPAGGWSAVECLMHLNLTAKQYIPLLNTHIAQARRDQMTGDAPFSMDLTGRFLAWFLEPPYRMKGKTSPEATPGQARSPKIVLEEFKALNPQLVSLLEEASGLALDQIRLASPFRASMKYNLYSAFRILSAHERRHLWQAERTIDEVSG
jgi:hypothetical protein